MSLPDQEFRARVPVVTEKSVETARSVHERNEVRHDLVSDDSLVQDDRVVECAPGSVELGERFDDRFVGRGLHHQGGQDGLDLVEVPFDIAIEFDRNVRGRLLGTDRVGKVSKFLGQLGEGEDGFRGRGVASSEYGSCEVATYTQMNVEVGGHVAEVSCDGSEGVVAGSRPLFTPEMLHIGVNEQEPNEYCECNRGKLQQ